MIFGDGDPEFRGGAAQLALQRAVWERSAQTLGRRGFFHGGRLIGIDDLEGLGDAQVSGIYDAVGAVIVKFIPAGLEADFIERFAGPERRFTGWDVFIGGVAARETARAFVENYPLAAGWKLSELTPDAPPGTITEIQAVQEMSGVAPVPGYYQRGKAVPAVVAMLRDDMGNVVATAQAYERHHIDSPWSGYIFAGMVAVHAAHRRKSLGTLINSFVVARAFERLNCSHVYEHARIDNLASRGMIEASGLRVDSRYRCVMFHDVGRFGEEFTK